jgi:hypothetical protein
LAICAVLVASGGLFGCRNRPRRTPPPVEDTQTECPDPQPIDAVAFSCDPLLEFAIAGEAMKKSGGAADGDAWVCSDDTCKAGIIVFGPYTEDVPTGRRLVRLDLRAEGFEQADEEIAGLEVWDAAAEKRLGLRGISAEVAAKKGEAWPVLSVPFDAPVKGRLEFRVSWTGGGTLRLRRLRVY